MMDGLPDDYYLAWLEYSKPEAGKVLLSYKYQLKKDDAPATFEPGDHLYPAQCVESMDKFLSEDKRNWIVCKIQFNSDAAFASYKY